MLSSLDIIIVNWNTKHHLRKCLESLQPQIQPGIDVVVVDNASSDGSVQMVTDEFSWVQLIASDTNLGFGKANNLALRQSKKQYALLLNSDTIAFDNAIANMVEFMLNTPKCGALGARLILPNGQTQSSVGEALSLWWVFCEQSLLAKLLPKSRIFGGYCYTWWNYNTQRKVKQVVGACMMMRRLPDGAFPLFDERYFMYAEDTELCNRIGNAGYELYYTPEAVFRHELGASSDQPGIRTRMISYYNISRLMYFNDHGGMLARFACLLILVGGSLLRMVIALLRSVVSRRNYPTNAGMWLGVLKNTIRGRVQQG